MGYSDVYSTRSLLGTLLLAYINEIKIYICDG